MNRRGINWLARVLLTLALLVLALSACQSSRLEPFAPELKKHYVTTEELVISTSSVPPPIGIFLGNAGRDTTVVMTQEWFEYSNGIYEGSYPDMVQPNRGAVIKGSFVQVKQMFSFSIPDGTTRYAKVDITDPKMGDTLNAYMVWGIVDSALQEVEFKEAK